MWMLLEDTFTCRNTVATSRMMSVFIMVFGLAILATGIADVVTYVTMCQKPIGSPVTDHSALAVGIWGSLPIIFTGMLANFLIDNTAFTIKFLQMSTLASGVLFAPAVVVISAIDAALQPSQMCGTANSYAMSVCLAVFGGMAVFLLWVLLYRLYCSTPVDDDQHALVVGKKAQRVYAQKDEFMISNVPQIPELNNGGSNSIDPSALPVHQLHIPIGGAQRAQTSWGYVPSQGGSQQLAQLGQVAQLTTAAQAPYNASPKQQLAVAQLQQAQTQGYNLQNGEQNYYVTFLPGDKIVTNAYPQLYKMSG